MDELQWSSPVILRDWLMALLVRRGPLPPAKPGVYVVTLSGWTGSPSIEAGPLHVGGSGVLLERFMNLVPALLGFYATDPWIGRHYGGRKVREYCRKKRKQVGDLILSWAPTSLPCCWCVERILIDSLTPLLVERVPTKCYCPEDIR